MIFHVHDIVYSSASAAAAAALVVDRHAAGAERAHRVHARKINNSPECADFVCVCVFIARRLAC